MSTARSGLRRDGESVLGFLIFPITYLALSALVVRRWMPMSAFAGNAERRELHFASAFAIVILATLLASLGHVATLGWMRAKYPQLRLGPFVVQQLITAVLSAVTFLHFDLDFLGAAVLLAPAGITLLVYVIGEHMRDTVD